MKKVVQWPRIGRVLILGLMASLFLPACQPNANSAKAPDFTLLDLQNEIVSLSDFKGKVVLLNFFATHCPPCRLEMPDFVKLQNQYGSDGFVTIAISVDQNGEKVLPPFLKSLEINFPVLLATSKVLKDYGDVYALPVSFLIGKDQKIIKQYMGMVTQDELEPLVVQALNQQI